MIVAAFYAHGPMDENEIIICVKSAVPELLGVTKDKFMILPITETGLYYVKVHCDMERTIALVMDNVQSTRSAGRDLICRMFPRVTITQSVTNPQVGVIDPSSVEKFRTVINQRAEAYRLYRLGVENSDTDEIGSVIILGSTERTDVNFEGFTEPRPPMVCMRVLLGNPNLNIAIYADPTIIGFGKPMDEGAKQLLRGFGVGEGAMNLESYSLDQDIGLFYTMVTRNRARTALMNILSYCMVD
ncbi:hypothetical protein [Clostridium sp.]|uniref:hypothetical protein n=1 Tax=Clostridium sp. TaxID=1506 RepID=UPI003F669597